MGKIGFQQLLHTNGNGVVWSHAQSTSKTRSVKRRVKSPRSVGSSLPRRHQNQNSAKDLALLPLTSHFLHKEGTNMKIPSSAALLFTTGCLVARISADGTGADIDSVGDASRFSPQTEIEITDNGDDTCSYTLTFTYTHDPTIESPEGECSSSENYYDFGEQRDLITSVTPFDHISIDWNQCGHIPPGIWDVAHYDLHIYLQPFDWDMRQTMLCQLDAAEESCAPPENQTTPEGLAFFDIPMNEEDKLINSIDIPEPYFL